MSTIKSVKEFLKIVPPWANIIFGSLIVIIVVFLTYASFTDQFNKLSYDVINPLDSAYQKNLIMLDNITFNLNVTEVQREILKSKITVMQDKKEHHMFLTRSIYRNNYALLSLFPFLSAITGIFVFFTIQNGWKESNIYLKSGLIIFGTLTALVSVFPDIYQQKQSIDDNLKNYIEYDNLQHEIFCYSLTAPILKGDTIEFVNFIDGVNTKEMGLNKIYFVLSEEEFSNPIFDEINGLNN